MPSQLSSQPSMDRRAFLRGSTAVAVGVGVAVPFQALLAHADQGRGRDRARPRRGAVPTTGRWPR